MYAYMKGLLCIVVIKWLVRNNLYGSFDVCICMEYGADDKNDDTHNNLYIYRRSI
jgi:hypothetical protein